MEFYFVHPEVTMDDVMEVGEEVALLFSGVCKDATISTESRNVSFHCEKRVDGKAFVVNRSFDEMRSYGVDMDYYSDKSIERD